MAESSRALPLPSPPSSRDPSIERRDEDNDDDKGHDNGKQVQKKKRTRTKTGCITCRIRRVKCDETRPACQRCVSTGRKCDGWTEVPMSRRDLTAPLSDRKSVLLSCHTAPSNTNITNNTEALFFDFFLQKTAPSTNSLFGTTFWSRSVLQLSQTEPSIKHAVLAISSLHQGWDLYGSSVVDVDRNAVAQYGKAMSAAKSLLARTQGAVAPPDKHDVQKVLVACILFVCFENLMGDYTSAATHLGHGLQILEDYPNILAPSSGADDEFDSELVEIINRYYFQSLTFAQSRFPFRQQALRYSRGPPPPLPTSFENMSEVRATLFEAAIWAMSVGEVLHFSRSGISQHETKSPQEMIEELLLERRRTLANLKHWWMLFEEFGKAETERTGVEFTGSVPWAWLSVYYQISRFGLEAGCSTDELEWDISTDEFETLVDRCEFIVDTHTSSKSPLSLDMGVCVPLFITGHKCRHPGVRRRAIAALDRVNRKEGIWETVPAARVCERLMNLEEAEAKRIWATRGEPNKELLTSADLPRESRIITMFAEVDLRKRFINMKINIGFWGGPEEPRTIFEKVDF